MNQDMKQLCATIGRALLAIAGEQAQEPQAEPEQKAKRRYPPAPCAHRSVHRLRRGVPDIQRTGGAVSALPHPARKSQSRVYGAVPEGEAGDTGAGVA